MAATVFVALVSPEKGIEVATMPLPERVPVQVRLPVELATVQPVAPDPPAILTSPVAVPLRFKASAPLLSMERATSVSPPVAARVTTPPVAAFVKVASLTAEAVVPNLIDSLPLVSKISAPVNLRSPPKVVKLSPDIVNVLSKVVAPCKVKVPGVVVEPIVLTDEAPVPIVELPLEVRLVKAPARGVALPMVPVRALEVEERVKALE